MVLVQFQAVLSVMDGYLQRIRTPSQETENARSYFSGHYQTNGINIQVVCDHYCWGISICVAVHGETNNTAAFSKSALNQVIQKFPIGKYVGTDNAYIFDEHLFPLFPKGVS